MLTLNARCQKQQIMRRRYSLKSPNFITWVVSCVNRCSFEKKSILLDDFEMRRTKSPKRWAEIAPIEEIFIVLVKLGYDTSMIGMSSQKQGAVPNIKTYHDFNENGDIDIVMDEASESQFFCMTSREVMKMQVLYSQILNGSWYVPNKDFKTFVNVMKSTRGYLFEKNRIDFDYDNMKTIINAVHNFYMAKPILDLNETDNTILFYLALHDDKPQESARIKEIFEHKRSRKIVSNSMKKLFAYEYMERFGSEKAHTAKYTLTHKGWGAIGLSLKEFMKDIKFWDAENIKQKQVQHEG